MDVTTATRPLWRECSSECRGLRAWFARHARGADIPKGHGGTLLWVTLEGLTLTQYLDAYSSGGIYYALDEYDEEFLVADLMDHSERPHDR